MLDIQYEDEFIKNLEKIRDNSMKDKVKKQIAKAIENPEIGKTMRYLLIIAEHHNPLKQFFCKHHSHSQELLKNLNKL